MIKLKIKMQGKVLQDYWDSKLSNQIIIGPLGSSKTHTTCLKIVSLMGKQDPDKNGIRHTRWIAVRNTYSELHTTTIADWEEVNGYLGEVKRGGGGRPPHQNILFDLPDGTTVKSSITFLALDLPKDVKKLRGMNITGGWLNEVKELPKAVLDMLDLRVGRYNPGGVNPNWFGVIGDSNSPDTDHWLYDLAEITKPKGWGFYKQPGGVVKDDKGSWIINPLAENINNLPKNYYLRGLEGKSDDWISVNLGNLYGFVSEGQPVHPTYNDNVHCRDIEFTPDITKPIIAGLDAGRDICAVFMQETLLGGFVIFDEFQTDGQTPAVEFAPLLKEYITRHYTGYDIELFIDPAGNSRNQSNDETPIKILESKGLPVKPTNTNDPIIRRAAVDVLLKEMDMAGQPKFTILPCCDTLRKGLAGGFCYKRVMVSGEERYKNEPDKNKYSHIVESLEYGLLGGYGLGQAIIETSGPKHDYDDWAFDVNN